MTEDKNIFTLPYFCEDFLTYMETILGKSKNTVHEYRYDLVMFLRFLKCLLYVKHEQNPEPNSNQIPNGHSF